MDTKRGYYGVIGEQCVIKSTKTVKDVNFGDYAYVKGANKLKNLTVKSSDLMTTQIGEGCKIFYDCKNEKDSN
jgi:hypothetical protein